MTKRGYRGRGSVGKMIRVSERLQIDLEFRKRKHKEWREYRRKNRKYILKYRRNYENLLNEFRNRHCLLCRKLLNHRAKGDYCRECLLSNFHIIMLKRKKIKGGKKR